VREQTEEKSGEIYLSVEEDLDVALGLAFRFDLCNLFFRLDAITSDIIVDLFSFLGNLLEYIFRRDVCGESYFGSYCIVLGCSQSMKNILKLQY